MRKAINFDIDTKKYEEYTGKDASMAYAELKSFFDKVNFEHRQGSGYISKHDINDTDVLILVTNMSLELNWLNYSIKAMDVTDIGKQHSLIDVINRAPIEKKRALIIPSTIDHTVIQKRYR